MRHAKSSWSTDQSDADRPLSGRGRRDAVSAGRCLVTHRIGVDRVLCSSAARARETLERMGEGGFAPLVVTHHRELYDEGPDTMLELVRELPDEVQTVLMLGHVPQVQLFVDALGVRDSHDGWETLTEKYPTSAISVLAVDKDWQSVDWGSAQLVSFEVPRG